jgi:hypothetical protein
MRRLRHVLVLALVLAVSQALASSAQVQTFPAHLTGAAERPTPVETDASGEALFRLSEDGTISYRLIVRKIENLAAAHIHLGDSETAGPILVHLYPVNSTGREKGLIATGVISEEDIVGPAEDPLTMEELVAQMNAGNTYANVHTQQNPGGEIRGQITPTG